MNSELNLTMFGLTPNETLEDTFTATTVPDLGDKLVSKEAEAISAKGDMFGRFGDFASPGWKLTGSHEDFVELVCERYDPGDDSDDCSDDGSDDGNDSSDDGGSHDADALSRLLDKPFSLAKSTRLAVGPFASGKYYVFTSRVPVSFGVLLYAHAAAFVVDAMAGENTQETVESYQKNHDLSDFLYCQSADVELREKGVICNFCVDFS